MKKRTGKECSELQEKEIAKLVGGKTQANSGGTKFGGGDVLTKDFFIEAKTQTVDKSSFTIKREWIDKANEQCYEQGRAFPVLAFRFDPEGEDHFVIDANLFRTLVRHMENREN